MNDTATINAIGISEPDSHEALTTQLANSLALHGVLNATRSITLGQIWEIAPQGLKSDLWALLRALSRLADKGFVERQKSRGVRIYLLNDSVINRHLHKLTIQITETAEHQSRHRAVTGVRMPRTN